MQKLGNGETKVVTVRFAVEDYERLVENAAPWTVSEYVRRSALGNVKSPKPEIGKMKVEVAGKSGLGLSLPEYPADGSRGPRFGGFMWYGQECPERCTCRLCCDWRVKLGVSLP